MSELKPDSEKKEERLSDKEKVNTEKTNAEELNAEELNAEELNAEELNAEELNAEKPNAEKLNAEKPNTEEINEEPPAASEDEDFFFDDNKAYEARRAARLERRNKLRRRKKRLRIAGCIVVVAAAAIGIGIGFYGEELQNFVSEQQVKIAQMVKSADRKTEEEKTAQQTNAEAEAENAVTPEVQDTDGLSEEDKTLYRQAKYAAKQYDYDKAISMLQNSETYQTSEKFQHAVKVYQKKKESCVSWPLDQVTHVFYHTLIKDTGKAFDGDYKSGDYDQGEPIYTYSLKEGIEDGFLAPFKVINVMTDIGEGWRPRKGQCDIYGNEIEDRIYTNSDYDYNIIIEDRIQQVAAEITNYLKSTDRMAKTIVFCATEDAAERMRVALVNQNSDMVQKNPDYVVRITGSDTYGKSKLDYFISVREKYPVIATTSKLLSTGSDCKMTKLIVLDEMIGSMTEFKQIIGRGTRLREKEGKTHFVVMDFRNVSRLFADPDWDGPIEMDEDFNPKSGSERNTKPPVGPGPDPIDPKQPKPIVNRDGCQVKIVYKTVSVYDANGKLLRQESIIDYTKENILGAYASLDNFIRKWSAEEKKEKIKGLLREQGIDLETLKEDQGMSDVDDFDFICHIAFDKKPLTRKERAENVKKRDFLNKYSGAAREVLEALLDKYMNTGIYEIEKTEILKLDPFMRMGKPQKIASYFGGKDGYLKAVKELENAIYDGGAA